MENLKYEINKLELELERIELHMNKLLSYNNVPKGNYDEVYTLSIERKKLIYAIKILKDLRGSN